MIYLGLLLFFVLEYVRPSNYFPVLLRANSILPLAVATAAVLKNSQVSNGDVVQTPTTKRLLWFIALLVLSIMTSDVTERAVNITWAVLGYVLMYWVIVKTVTSLKLLKGVFITILIVHVAVAVLNPQLFGSVEREYILAGPFLGDGNDFALSLNIALPLCLFLMLDARKLALRFLWAGVGLLFVFCIVVTQSRGGTLALLCVGAFYWTASRQKLRVGVAVLLALALVLAVAPASYFGRMQNLTNTEEGSAQGRIQAWKAGAQMAIDNPLLGVGAGMFGVMYGAAYGSPIGPQTAHSIYFLALGELGLPGLIWLVMFLWNEFSDSRRLRQTLPEQSADDRASRARQLLASMTAALIAFATGGAFLSALYYPHLYVVSGLLVASRRIADESGRSTITPLLEPKSVPVTIHWALRPRGAEPASTAR